MIKENIKTFYEARKTLIWFIVFFILSILYFDFWNWGKSTPFFYGLPYWIIYHIILTILTGLVFYIFVQSIWGDE